MVSLEMPVKVGEFLDILANGELPSGIPFKQAVMGFILVVFLFETYLEFRQLGALKRPNIPESLKEVITEKSFKSTQHYCLDKWFFSMFMSVFSLTEEMLMLHFNVLSIVWTWTLTPLAKLGLTEENEIIRSIMFTVIFTLLSTLIKLPFSVYSTFVLEEKHGFNKQTVRLFFSDMVKSLALMLVFVPVILSVMLPIIQFGGRLLALWLWLFMFCFSLLMMSIYPVLIAPLFNKYDPLPEGKLRTKIEALAASLNFPLKKLFVIDGSARSAHSNAYMYGFFKNKRIVLYDTLLKQCEGNDEEIVAVLAHELGHWKLNHTVFTFTTMQLMTFSQFALFMVVRNTSALYSAFGFSDQPALISLMLFQQIVAPIDHVVGFLNNMLSRRFEFQADEFAVNLNYAESLRGGLIRLQETNKSSSNIDPWYSAYHHTHPPLVERLKALHQKKE
mmetsp:Transcript_34276/g.47512  ORF Transcript_34276/g.47512 Transcript_34276/m.47512 type:complete len:446 (-) Transcript_34276:169-1506(-)|eukprot:CAMPEP_0196597682 /NCGR_PEP_ID=MMETSP1081-20130531/92469_1 /TAXON_ID=36882 /ORGANISM="Pyramimonas amylifera, Strain CCMP720" /LENGTH=445 /DNA_ID=CAMNT_0041923169 /DNA_START=88 /DNA_END=1425 /DNA_ORIENTATION=-